MPPRARCIPTTPAATGSPGPREHGGTGGRFS
ncbi:hypothetical protein STRTUCAR8_07734, partial [Streptomyces turgidiscabies Car8]